MLSESVGDIDKRESIPTIHLFSSSYRVLQKVIYLFYHCCTIKNSVNKLHFWQNVGHFLDGKRYEITRCENVVRDSDLLVLENI